MMTLDIVIFSPGPLTAGAILLGNLIRLKKGMLISVRVKIR